jgi:hypothetical protein
MEESRDENREICFVHPGKYDKARHIWTRAGSPTTGNYGVFEWR